MELLIFPKQAAVYDISHMPLHDLYHWFMIPQRSTIFSSYTILSELCNQASITLKSQVWKT
jgi:hypothetical protein